MRKFGDTGNRRVRTFHLAVVLGLVVASRMGLYLIMHGSLNLADEMNWDGWGRIAHFVATGQGFVDSQLLTYFKHDGVLSTAARPPLPILIFAACFRLFGEHLFPVVVVQTLIDVATAAALYGFGSAFGRAGLFGGWATDSRAAHRLGLIAAIGFAGFLPAWRTAAGFFSEPLFTLLLTMGLALSILNRGPMDLGLSGVFFGLATLARPIVLPLPILLVPVLAWSQGTQWRRAVLVPFFAMLLIAPWGVRNTMTLGRPALQGTLGGYNLLRHSGAIEQDDFLRWVPVEEGEARIRALVDRAGRSLEEITEPELDDLLRHDALVTIAAHPWRYLQLSGVRALWLFYDPRVGTHAGMGVRFLHLFFDLMLFALVVFAVRRHPGPWVRRMAPVWTMVALSVVVHALTVAQFRYFVPVVPGLLWAAAFGVASILESAPVCHIDHMQL